MIWNDDTEQTVGISRDENCGKVTITYVDIVRCKDCAYYKDGGCGNIEPSSPCRNLLDVKPDWFCPDGEPK